MHDRYELKSRNLWQSVGFQYKSVLRRWSIKLTVTSRKLTDFLNIWLVNFKFGWILFKFSKNSSSFSSLLFQIKKMSSMYLSHDKSFTVYVSNKINFNIIHEDTCVWWWKFGPYGSTRDLLFEFWIKFKEIVLEYKFWHVTQIWRRNFFIWLLF